MTGSSRLLAPLGTLLAAGAARAAEDAEPRIDAPSQAPSAGTIDASAAAMKRHDVATVPPSSKNPRSAS